ncbi:uncharacterized protein LOC131071665 isoform X4 [Cryptomeria japonica]|uniref:uncharacterized protein LOC131071665 isoform X4 n=1 Tax=Cryptomeria japonica TaxID=3369 RepID=UPI0025AD1AC1|nr:uncharacterized protein LOC131071665 isoform X4 [Cryptomeria japonica]
MGKRTRLHEASRHVDQSTPVKTETKGTKAKGLIEAKNKIPTTRLRSVDQSPEKTPCIIATYESALADSLIQLWERELLESAGPSLDEQNALTVNSSEGKNLPNTNQNCIEPHINNIRCYVGGNGLYRF